MRHVSSCGLPLTDILAAADLIEVFQNLARLVADNHILGRASLGAVVLKRCARLFDHGLTSLPGKVVHRQMLDLRV